MFFPAISAYQNSTNFSRPRCNVFYKALSYPKIGKRHFFLFCVAFLHWFPTLTAFHCFSSPSSSVLALSSSPIPFCRSSRAQSICTLICSNGKACRVSRQSPLFYFCSLALLEHQLCTKTRCWRERHFNVMASRCFILILQMRKLRSSK